MRRPMILDVNPDPGLPWEQDRLARMSLVSCCGPDTRGGCPLLRGEECTKVEKADGVLFRLDLDRGENRRILGMYLRQLDVPIRVVATPEQRVRWANFLDLVEVLSPPIDPAEMDAFALEVTSEPDDR